MSNALAKQTAVVLVGKLPDDYCLDDLTKPVERIKTAEVWQCFYTNQGLKVVQHPPSRICIYPYTVVDRSGWYMPRSETYSLERAIAYCDLCIANIRELSHPIFIPNALSLERKKQVEDKIRKILGFLDYRYPELEELERV